MSSRLVWLERATLFFEGLALTFALWTLVTVLLYGMSMALPLAIIAMPALAAAGALGRIRWSWTSES